VKNTKPVLVAIVATLALVLSACSGGDGGATTTQAPTTTAAQPTTTAAATTTGAPSGAPAIPEDHEGRAQCLACHAAGVGGAPQPPAMPDHSGLSDDRAVCTGCHAEE
jgi:cytochrome c5